MRNRLLWCLAKAVAKHGAKFVCGLVPGGDVFYDIVTDTWKDWHRSGGQEGDLRAEVEKLAQATADQVRQEVQEVVQAEAAGLPPEEREALATYLVQMPGTIRRSLRRPSDPTGCTVPGGLCLQRPEDLLRFLPTRPPRFKPGDRPLPGVDWVLEELVGVGGFGEVWKARHAHLKSKPPVALKFCLDESAVSALWNEAGVLDRVMRHGRHPGVVALLQTYLSAAPPCLEYEYIEGGDLAGLIQEMHARGRLKPDKANRLLLHLAEVVASAHRANPPIVHCDLKPANILVQRDEVGKLRLRVTDFGIGGLAAAQAARETRQPTRSRQELLTDAVRGAYTPLYASPQQMARRPGESADPRDDVHALGVIWLQVLTGDLGMVSKPTEWREIVQGLGLGEDLVKLLGACIANEAERRPSSAVALADQLRTCLHIGKGPEKPPEKDQGIMVSPSAPVRPASPPPGEPIALLGIKFAWIPPGAFLMGGNKRHREKPAHRVTLSKGFYLGAYPVSQAEWRAVMGYNPSKFLGDDRPVEMVSWNDCQELCQRLATLTGKPIRLPTEAEWEYACRAGTNRDYYSGDGMEVLRQVGWYDQNSEQQTRAVGRLAPNDWGLYDMHGNVWEWCQDWFGPYASESVVDPTGPDAGEYRVLRGGSWTDDMVACRVAFRGNETPGLRAAWVGCRVCFCPV
jgi:formylglycine-generating enzyme required for sulfatase activity